MKKLKGKEASDGRKLIIKEFVDEEAKQMKIRHHDIRMENFRLPESHRAEIAFQKDSMFINQEQYVKEVKPPKMKDALLINKENENILDELKFHASEVKEISGSSFQTFAINVHSVEQVQQVYNAIQLKHISATHKHTLCVHIKSLVASSTNYKTLLMQENMEAVEPCLML